MKVKLSSVSIDDYDKALKFYTEVLGMDLVLRQPNLDFPLEEHLFFHVGNDNFIAYFVPVDEAVHKLAPAAPGSGGMDHLALDVDEAGFEDAIRRLTAAGNPRPRRRRPRATFRCARPLP